MTAAATARRQAGTMMSAARWRALNILYGLSMRARDIQDRAPATVEMLDALGIERDVLVELERIGYARARFARTTTRAALATDNPKITVVDLTSTAIAWWHANPYQGALMAAAWRSDQTLRELVRRGLQPEAVVAIVQAGYAYVVCSETGPVTRPTVKDLGDYLLTVTWHLHATAEGRRIVAWTGEEG